MAKLTPVEKSPGIFRRHLSGCRRPGRCDCSYVVVWRHRGKQHTATFRTLAEAREAKGKKVGVDSKPTTRETFGAYFAEWIDTYAGRTARGFSETTRPEYRRPIEQHALDKWNGWKLADIGPRDVKALYGQLRREGVSTAGIKKLRAPLSALFATAAEDGLISASPMVGVRIPAGPETSTTVDAPAKALTRAELGTLLAEIPTEWRLFFELLAHTGIRVSEAIGLTWAHLDLGANPRVQVREQFYRGERKRLKSRYSRRDIPLSAGMAERLRAHRRDNYTAPDMPVFASKAGTELRPSNVRRRVLTPAGKSVGLGWVGFHTFRHSCASLLFEQGRNIKQVQEWLGHADPGFTLRTYVHLMDDGVGGADFLDDVVRVNSRSTEGPGTPANQPTGQAASAPV